MINGLDLDFAKAKLFLGNSTATNINPVSYQVPFGARLIYIFGAGAGAGGGGGASGPSGTTRGGGSGTSTTSTVEAIIPAALVPTTLLFEVGKGGIGGAADTVGGAAGFTRILMPQRFNRGRTDFLTLLSLGRAVGGNPGLTTASAAGTNFDAVASAPPVIAIQNSLGGGSTGGAHTGGASAGSGSSVSTSTQSTGGAGVGTNDVSFSAGNTSTMRVVILGGSAAAGFNGNNGFTTDPLDFQRPFVRNGATGGASNGTGTGGNGGNGSLGVSGAGGGGGVTGGRGGDGGDGFIIAIPIF